MDKVKFWLTWPNRILAEGKSEWWLDSTWGMMEDEKPNQISQVGDSGQTDLAGFLLKFDNAETGKPKSQSLDKKWVQRSRTEVSTNFPSLQVILWMPQSSLPFACKMPFFLVPFIHLWQLTNLSAPLPLAAQTELLLSPELCSLFFPLFQCAFPGQCNPLSTSKS